MSDSLESRFNKITLKGNPFTPPPPGVYCDCDGEDSDEHFHVRCMVAVCDSCVNSFQADYLVYTREAGYQAVEEDARQRGWHVEASRNYYLCGDCVATSFPVTQ